MRMKIREFYKQMKDIIRSPIEIQDSDFNTKYEDRIYKKEIDEYLMDKTIKYIYLSMNGNNTIVVMLDEE